MAKSLGSNCSLSQERKNEIAHRYVDRFVFENFRFTSPGDYRRKLGDEAQKLGGNVTADELHQFFLDKLPQALGKMFEWDNCSITGVIEFP